MTYSCSDFTDDILDALDIIVPEDAMDSPDMQATLAIEEIERLKSKDKHGAFTHLDMEAALCIWEAVNEWTLDNEEELATLTEAAKDDEHSHAAIRLEWIAIREITGSAEMRSQCSVLAKWLLEVYDLLTGDNEEFFGHWSYDWEVVPLILKYAVGSDGKASMYRGDYVYTGTHLIDPHTAAQFVAQEILYWNFKELCQREAEKMWAYRELITDHEDLTEIAFSDGVEPAKFTKWLGEKFDLIPKGKW